ncbi:WD repeat-containing protein [Verticillium alfalfae VaMs.102]|uniref:WD repeat-containing protein n=1 Tax=Verticillium alfalfae (strain VaMs.102 / ATCC MYA-4576 / FGSC 10136) TaxID=526221 RepID=C9SL68_VERA1|nr:WD repeat-containing protein [Verticillium alfalfae VaMs.102]EEY19436.1 WD repeat-containing protein [Verticillium alfalfae VaMs.102]
MESSNQENFFETDVQQEKRKQRALKQDNPFGNPIRLPSKVLAVLPDPTNPNALLTAESSGRVARISLTSRKPTAKFAGPAVPVTSLATSGTTLFAGAWDKTIWSWDLRTGAPQRRYAGHADFVKTLAAARLGGRDVLLSGGADKKILVWDVATGRRLHALQDPAAAMMSLQSLAVDPVASSDDELVVVSASSDPVVRRWRVRLDGAEMVAGGEVGGEAAGDAALATGGAISEHETSVYKVLFDQESEEIDLWTASADGTAKCLARGKGFTTEDTFEHGDFVKGLVLTETWVVTGGFSQDIKVWDRTSGSLVYTISAHFDEITDLIVLRDPSGKKDTLVSISIDRTIRTWSLDKQALDETVEEIRKAGEPVEEDEQQAKTDDDKKEGLMTADEEAELAALMDSD